MRTFNKIFGVGLSRTGTSSLTTALERLGLPTIHWPLSMAAFCQNRAATDLTVSCRFEELDQLFPDSLFVYTEREFASWLPSVVKHYQATSQSNSQLNQLLVHNRLFAQEADVRVYGSTHPTPDQFQAAYTRHHEKVLRWSQGKEGRLLRMNIVSGDGWPRLCAFLEVPVVEQPFPWKNRRSHPALAPSPGAAST